MTIANRALAVGLIAAIGLVARSAPTDASAFVAWKVSDVPSEDVLMVRTDPSPQSPILVGYPDGVMLSMTGRCTGGVRLDEIQALPGWRQRRMIRAEWCEVWLDPYGNGEFRGGWVYGRFIAPA